MRYHVDKDHWIVREDGKRMARVFETNPTSGFGADYPSKAEADAFALELVALLNGRPLAPYVTGDNAPGYLPEGDPRGPWNGWDDAVRDLASLIEDDAEQRLDDARHPDAQSYVRGELTTARAEVEALRGKEDPRGADVVFMGRAFFIRPAEESDTDR